jgi:NADPH2:quinone reductase
VARFVPRGLDEMNASTRQALDAAADRRLQPVVGQTFPLERAADAHAAIEARTTIGKTLLRVEPLH